MCDSVLRRTKKSPETSFREIPRNKALAIAKRHQQHERLIAIAEKHRKQSGMLRGAIPVCVGDKRVVSEGMVDSGSEITIIDTAYLNLHPEIRPASRSEVDNGYRGKVSLDGIGGLQETLESFRIRIAVLPEEDDVATVTTYVATLPPGVQVLLGRNWMTKVGALINLRTNEVELRHTTVPCDLKVEDDQVESYAALYATVRVGARRHIEVPAAVDAGEQNAGKVMLFTPRVENARILCPSYVALVDEHGKAPFVVSNPTSRKLRLKANTILFDMETSPIMTVAVASLSTTTAESATKDMGTSEPNVAAQDGPVARPCHATTATPAQTVSAINTDGDERRTKVIEELDLKHLNSEQQGSLRDLLRRHISTISDGESFGKTTLLKHTIDTGDAQPVVRQPYRRSPAESEIIEEEVKKNLRLGAIEQCASPWAAPVVLVRKKDGTTRFCIDYRGLNAVTRKVAYLMPRVDECLESMAGCKWFTGLDLKSGYWQIDIEEQDRPKSAFRTRSGQYRWKVMPFGLINAPATFQRLMDTVLMGLTPEFAMVYVDDIIIYTRGDFGEHVAHIERILKALGSAGLQLSLAKCQFAMSRLAYLGHIVSGKGIETDPKKVESILRMKEPRNQHEIKSFLGGTGYYRRFIRGFAELALPLNALLSKNKEWLWTPDCQKAFEQLRSKLASAPVLAFPDWTKPFFVETDGGPYAVSAILSQASESGELRPVAYWSKTFDATQRHYAQPEREVYAVIKGLEAYQPYIWGRHFTLITDAKALTWLQHACNERSKLARWAIELQEYDYSVEHRPGRLNKPADMLTRVPSEDARNEEAGVLRVEPADRLELGDRTQVLLATAMRKSKRVTWNDVVTIMEGDCDTRGTSEKPSHGALSAIRQPANTAGEEKSEHAKMTQRSGHSIQIPDRPRRHTHRGKRKPKREREKIGIAIGDSHHDAMTVGSTCKSGAKDLGGSMEHRATSATDETPRDEEVDGVGAAAAGPMHFHPLHAEIPDEEQPETASVEGEWAKIMEDRRKRDRNITWDGSSWYSPCNTMDATDNLECEFTHDGICRRHGPTLAQSLQ